MKDKKQFEWQYSDEKLLLKQHENLISFLLRKSHLFIVYIVLSIIIFIFAVFIKPTTNKKHHSKC